MQEAERGLFRLRELRPILLGAVEQAEGADDVRLDERLGRIDGAVHVRLGGKVDHRVDRVLGEEAGHEGRVADVALRKDITRAAGEVGEVGGIAGVGQRIEVDEPREGRARFSETLADEVGADEAAAAGDE